MTLREDNTVERRRELEIDRHPGLLTGDVQPSDGGHVGRLLAFLSQRLDLASAALQP